MRYKLHIDGKLIGEGTLSVGQDGAAHFFEGEAESGDATLAEMTRTRLEFAAASGLRLSGFMWTGKISKTCVKLYRYCEWWVSYL